MAMEKVVYSFAILFTYGKRVALHDLSFAQVRWGSCFAGPTLLLNLITKQEEAGPGLITIGRAQVPY